MPLAPQHMDIQKSDICPKMLSKFPYGESYKSKKLVGTFNKKSKYILHYQALKLYISLGLKVSKLHRVLSFNQSPFMHEYIQHIAKLRSASQSDFEKSCLKKLANSNYGKMIEDVRKHREVKVCQNKQSFMKTISSPLFLNFKVFNENLVICFLKKKSIFQRSCHAIGLAILDLSKVHMYDLYYNHIIPETSLSPISKDLSIMMSDTDSFLFTFKNKTKEQFLKDIEHIMDFSNYPKNHKLFSLANAGQLGYLKDEMKGVSEIDAVVTLKSKCYSIKSKAANTNKCKGIPKIATSKLQFKHYKKALFEKKIFNSKFAKITSKDHKVATTSITRKSLTGYDDKRYYLCDIHSIPYGHYKINEGKLECLCR